MTKPILDRRGEQINVGDAVTFVSGGEQYTMEVSELLKNAMGFKSGVRGWVEVDVDSRRVVLVKKKEVGM